MTIAQEEYSFESLGSFLSFVDVDRHNTEHSVARLDA